jgi:pSer/pThr/pTyr-binding forkhead associated (FHA) protein
MIRLSLFLSGRLVSKDTFDRPEVTLGRDPSCDVVIDNLGVSRRHARVTLGEEGWFVEDLDSQNGVHVCGGRVERYGLLADDEFSIGKFTVKFEELSGRPAPVGVATAPEPVPAASPGVLGEEFGDHTFAMDRGEMERILQKARSPEPAATRAPRLTRIRPRRPPLTVSLTRNHYLAGTARSCDIRLKGWLTPKRAALLVRESGRDMVVSLSDARRVEVNGEKVDSRDLTEGDQIRIGRNLFVYSQA